MQHCPYYVIMLTVVHSWAVEKRFSSAAKMLGAHQPHRSATAQPSNVTAYFYCQDVAMHSKATFIFVHYDKRINCWRTSPTAVPKPKQRPCDVRAGPGWCSFPIHGLRLISDLQDKFKKGTPLEEQVDLLACHNNTSKQRIGTED